MEKNSNKKETEDKKEASHSSITNIIILMVSIIAVLGLILIGLKIFSPPSLDEIKQDIIEQGETEHGYLYNGFVFIYKDGLWHTEWQNGEFIYNLHFHYGPRDVEDVPIIGGLSPDVDTSQFYLTFEPTDDNVSLIAVASSELGLNLVKALNTKIKPACASNETIACSDRPIITCNNTDEAVIFVKRDDETKVTLDGNCMIIQGERDQLFRSVDKVLFNLYHVIEYERS